MLYFAYCTLLDMDEMRKYCPTARPVGRMRLPGYRLAFAAYGPLPAEGGCTLEEAPGKDLYGVLYEVAPDEFEALDRASGLDKGYWRRFDIVLMNDAGEKIPALTYVIPNPLGPFSPSPAYTRPILTGARAFHLPQTYITELESIIGSARRG